MFSKVLKKSHAKSVCVNITACKMNKIVFIVLQRKGKYFGVHKKDDNLDINPHLKQ